MPEPKLISPLLDGFAIGAPMSSRSGVCCCPAIKENSDKKYIVKIISIPASQVQLDALLLAKAYKDPADALEYFKSQADGILEEAGFLARLSKLEAGQFSALVLAAAGLKRLGLEDRIYEKKRAGLRCLSAQSLQTLS